MTNLSTPVLIAILVLAAIQLSLMVTALVALARTPAERVATGHKWLWVLIIVLVNLLGPILFFAIGRVRATVAIDAPSARLAEDSEAAAARTIRSLYGEAPGTEASGTEAPGRLATDASAEPPADPPVDRTA